MQCVMCGQAIQGPYYRVGPQEVCTPCRDRAVGQPSLPGALDATFARSIVTGMVGATVGSGVYFAALWIFHWYGAMLSVLVGAATGAGVNAGAGGRGTLRHRIVASLLTYGALAVVHAPIVMRDFAAVNRTDFGYAAFIALVLPIVAPFDFPDAGLYFTVMAFFALLAAWLLAGRSRADGAFTGPYRV